MNLRQQNGKKSVKNCSSIEWGKEVNICLNLPKMDSKD